MRANVEIVNQNTPNKLDPQVERVEHLAYQPTYRTVLYRTVPLTYLPTQPNLTQPPTHTTHTHTHTHTHTYTYTKYSFLFFENVGKYCLEKAFPMS